jgi:endonuclease III-like uncharacterized protein
VLHVHGVNDVRQTEIQTTVLLLRESNFLEVETATENLKTHKSPSVFKIQIELIQAEGKTLRSQFQKLIHPIWNKHNFHTSGGYLVIVTIYDG